MSKPLTLVVASWVYPYPQTRRILPDPARTLQSAPVAPTGPRTTREESARLCPSQTPSPDAGGSGTSPGAGVNCGATGLMSRRRLSEEVRFPPRSVLVGRLHSTLKCGTTHVTDRRCDRAERICLHLSADPLPGLSPAVRTFCDSTRLQPEAAGAPLLRAQSRGGLFVWRLKFAGQRAACVLEIL